MDSHGSGKTSPYMALPAAEESTATPKIYEPSSHRFIPPAATSPEHEPADKKKELKEKRKKKKKKKGCFLMCFSNMVIHDKEDQDKVLQLLEDRNNKCCFLMCFSNLGVGSSQDQDMEDPNGKTTKY